MRIGIVGMGQAGQERARCVGRLPKPDLVLAAVCDISPEKAVGFDVPCTRDYQELLGCEDIEAVFVCIPNSIAPGVVVAALEAGKHVFCEKPPGRTVEDVERMLAAERANPGLKLQFGFNHRYHPAVRDARLLLATWQEEIWWMRGTYGWVPDNVEGQWRSLHCFAGGGILLDQGIHMLDLFRWLAGVEFEYVLAISDVALTDLAMERDVLAILRPSREEFPMVSIHSSATQWSPLFRLEIGLPRGLISIEGLNTSSGRYGRETKVTYNRLSGDGRKIGYKGRDWSWDLETASFVEAVVKGTSVQMGHSGDALETMKLVHRVYDAARNADGIHQ